VFFLLCKLDWRAKQSGTVVTLLLALEVEVGEGRKTETGGEEEVTTHFYHYILRRYLNI
jgi:hypothetical protein